MQISLVTHREQLWLLRPDRDLGLVESQRYHPRPPNHAPLLRVILHSRYFTNITKSSRVSS